uniref:Reverse transcriptase zinc-binding domain-containing protein n=1 Tax=Physcomitrium patens TaxID=3218 RepID=A0A2K1L4I7_PHYPA|nr:hypothetical protein PHYPA_003738 [Physcomitrium patens]
MLKTRHKLPSVVESKWAGVLPRTFKLRWLIVWDPEPIRKEVGLLWLIWHRAVAVNAWRGRVSGSVDLCCLVCLSGVRETMLHCFWECPSAQTAWRRGIQILLQLLAPAITGTNDHRSANHTR